MKISFNLQFLLIIFFLVTLFMPLLSYIFHFNINIKLNENRELIMLPNLTRDNFENYPTYFQEAFSDHLPFRSFLINANHLIKLKLLNTSTSQDVTLGKDNWLFYTSGDNLMYSLNAKPFTDSELSQIKTNLEKTDHYFSSLGIHFYFMVAPNAQTIYPEYWPDNLVKVQPESRLEQLTSYLKKENSAVAFINPTSELLSAKKLGQIYYKYDTHWNNLGAFIAYQTLLNRVNEDFPDLNPLSLSDFTFSTQIAQRKDMEGMLGLSNYYQETEPILTAKQQLKSHVVMEKCPKQYISCPLITREVDDKTLPTLVMYRDSFAANMIPYLSEHFQKSTFIWSATPYSVDTVKKDKPDIVILELTERELWRLTNELFKENS